jgi:uncharacterized membrane protein YhhN
MEQLILLVLAFLTAVLEWVAVGNRWRKVEYFAKPGVMIFVLAWVVLSGGLWQGNLPWFTVGAFFSLLGDSFLLMRREKLGFGLGLSFFLLAHWCYIIAFNSPRTPIGLYSLILAALILVLATWVGWRILKNLRRKGLRRFIVPVILYILTLGTMLFSAWNININHVWKFLPALLVGLGASSFAVSDTLLAWNKFVTPLRYGRVLLMITYHIGQIAIMLGAVLQFT